jgi:hypothetical protein
MRCPRPPSTPDDKRGKSIHAHVLFSRVSHNLVGLGAPADDAGTATSFAHGQSLMNWKHVAASALAFPVAYFAGNIVFAVLAMDSWLPYALALILKPRALDAALLVAPWLTRLSVLAVLLGEFWSRRGSSPGALSARAGSPGHSQAGLLSKIGLGPRGEAASFVAPPSTPSEISVTFPTSIIDPPGPFASVDELRSFLESLDPNDHSPDTTSAREEVQDYLRWRIKGREDGAQHLLMAKVFKRAAKQEDDPDAREHNLEFARRLRQIATNTDLAKKSN